MPTLAVAALGSVILATNDSVSLLHPGENGRHEAMKWRLVLNPQEPSNLVLADTPEQLMRQIYQSLGEGERNKALVVAEHLTKRYPTFQLGQLLYADLLNISLRNPVEEAEVSEEVKPVAQRRLQELVLESTRRLLHPPSTGLAGKRPTGLIHLDPVQHPYVAAVDASRSRLYWFANRTGSNGSSQLELLMDTYISVGLQGVGKEREGDGKTPLGVYFIQKNLTGNSLPDLFGAGALTLNYPNAIDVMRKRTGSGIWLHGTPSAQYSRAPEATDGCVVLSNPEMAHLLGLGALRLTPVLIARELQWENVGQTVQNNAGLMQHLQAWNQARQQEDDAMLRKHYSHRFERDGLGLDQWWSKLRPAGKTRSGGKPLEMLSVLRWKDDQDWMVVTWLDSSRGTRQRGEYLRTYWALEEGQWRIVFEGPI